MRRISILLATLAACATPQTPSEAIVASPDAAPPVSDTADDPATVSDGEEIVEHLLTDDAAWFAERMANLSPQRDSLGETLSSFKALAGYYGAYTGSMTSIELEAGTRFRHFQMRLSYEHAIIPLSVTLNRDDQILNLNIDADWTPPEYAKPGSFTEKDITFGEAPWELPGTITSPAGEGPFPAIILVHGSGANGRDEPIGANKVFRDLAYGLASRGIVVLRYDKRTKAHTLDAQAVAEMTMDSETVDDAVLGLRLLRGLDNVDPKRTVAVGHSQGGYMMPRIATRSPELAGAVVMAGNTRPLHELMPIQLRYLADQDGRKLGAAERKIIKSCERIAALDPKNPPGDDERFFGGSHAAYWLDLVGYDPAALLAKTKVPALIMQGGRDYQVTEEDFAGWKKGLRRRKNISFQLYPLLGHPFTQGGDPPGPADYKIRSHVDAKVVDDLASWVLER